jgi:hypothetical protein
MSLGIVRLYADRLAICGNRLVELALLLQRYAAITYNNRGVARRHISDINGAIADLDQAIRLDQKLTVAYNNLCFARVGELDGASKDCNPIRLDPKLRDFAAAFGSSPVHGSLSSQIHLLERRCR